MSIDQYTNQIKLASSRKRVGRGNAVGGGTTAGRGSKGQKARTGHKLSPAFEGGQTAFAQRIPKQRGFHQRRRVVFRVMNLEDLSKWAEDGKLTLNILREKSFLKRPQDRFKILGEGILKEAIEVEAHAASQNAIEKIKAAGGKIIFLE
jgi:large subunit ribosomal protein L15